MTKMRMLLAEAMAALVIAGACGTADDTDWQGLLPDMEQHQERVALARDLAWLTEAALSWNAVCWDMAEVAGEIGNDLALMVGAVDGNLGWARSVYEDDRDPEVAEFLRELMGIDGEFLDRVELMIMEIRVDAELLGCWPEA